MAELPPSRILNYLHKMFNVRVGQALPQYAALSGRSSSDPFSYGQTQYSEDRLSRLREYDAMDLSSAEAWVALNTYAEESTQFSLDKKRTIWATSKDPEVVDILHTLFDELGAEEKMFGLTRHVCKYGEALVFPVVEAGAGITDLIVPHPSLVKIRFDENDYNKVIGYNCEALDIIQPSEMGYENPPMPKDIQVRSAEGFGPWDWVHFKIPGSDLATHYGASMMEGARRVWKTLAMLETAVALFRINKAGPRLHHKVFTGTTNPSETYKIMDNYIKSVKQTPFLSIKDPAAGGDGSLEEYLHWYKQNGFLDDIFSAAPKDAESDVSVLDVPFDLGALEDLEYWKTKYRTGWGIPKAYFDGDISGWGANKALAQQDVQFARKTDRIQKSIIGGMSVLCGLHLLYRGKTKFSFTLHMEPSSALGILQKLEVQQVRLTQLIEWVSAADTLGADKVKWTVKGPGKRLMRPVAGRDQGADGEDPCAVDAGSRRRGSRAGGGTRCGRWSHRWKHGFPAPSGAWAGGSCGGVPSSPSWRPTLRAGTAIRRGSGGIWSRTPASGSSWRRRTGCPCMCGLRRASWATRKREDSSGGPERIH